MNIQPLISAEELQTICKKLWSQITKDFEGKRPLVIWILKGCQPFMADLLRVLALDDLEVSYMKVRSYEGTTSTGELKVQLESDIEVAGRDVLLVEDIIDTGKTMKMLTETLLARGPKSVRVVALLDKPSRREVEFSADYVGKEIEDVFVVGYGMDYDEKYRHLPYVGVADFFNCKDFWD